MQLYIRGNRGIAKNRDLCLFRSVGVQTCNRLRDVSKISCAATRVDRGRSHAAGDRQCCVGLAGSLGVPVGGHCILTCGHRGDSRQFAIDLPTRHRDMGRLGRVFFCIVDSHSIALLTGQGATDNIDRQQIAGLILSLCAIHLRGKQQGRTLRGRTTVCRLVSLICSCSDNLRVLFDGDGTHLGLNSCSSSNNCITADCQFTLHRPVNGGILFTGCQGTTCDGGFCTSRPLIIPGYWIVDHVNRTGRHHKLRTLIFFVRTVCDCRAGIEVKGIEAVEQPHAKRRCAFQLCALNGDLTAIGIHNSLCGGQGKTLIQYHISKIIEDSPIANHGSIRQGKRAAVGILTIFGLGRAALIKASKLDRVPTVRPPQSFAAQVQGHVQVLIDLNSLSYDLVLAKTNRDAVSCTGFVHFFNRGSQGIKGLGLAAVDGHAYRISRRFTAALSHDQGAIGLDLNLFVRI